MKDITREVEYLLSQNKIEEVCKIIQTSMIFVELHDRIPVFDWGELCNLISRPDGSYTIIQA